MRELKPNQVHEGISEGNGKIKEQEMEEE